ncbi:MAG: putative aromatic amino acid decarboxylase [Ilumatobacteraceae bacterium]|nr:putative aromatic amino acid decarboxylase [Ilumatobacteraceae bacterium]
MLSRSAGDSPGPRCLLGQTARPHARCEADLTADVDAQVGHDHLEPGRGERVGQRAHRRRYGAAVTPDEFRKHGYQLIDWITEYLEHVEQLPVASTVRPGDVRAQLPEHPPAAPEPFDAVIADFERIVVPALTQWQHPSFFAYFPSNVSYPSILAELANAGLGIQGMSWVTSPACTEVETLMMDWMQELLGLPEAFRSTSATGGGVIHGSASEATLASILAARWRITGGAVNTDGDTSQLVAYATSQAHSSIEKGLRIAGIGTSQTRIVAHDTAFAMRPDHLAELVAADRAAGSRPFWVCATRGTTSSMAFDPTTEIGVIARREGLWLHVDAAMSGIGALVPEQRWINDGLELADSYCTNPHKWMGVNFDCDLFYTADRNALLGALSILPEYLRSAAAASGAVVDYRDWQLPLGRRFRSLKLWFMLRAEGVAVPQEMIRRHVALTAQLATWVRADPRFEIVAPAPLNLLCLRLRADDPAAGDLATDALIERANASGEALFTRTVLDGRVALRFSIGGRTTEERHVRGGWELLQALVAG